MKIEILALCDAATDNSGKLNILGTFDAIFAQKTPLVHPTFAVAARIRFEKSEAQDHTFKLVIIDYDGSTVVGPVEGVIAVRPVAGSDTVVANLILNFQGIELKRFGPNRIELSIDGRNVAEIPLYVRGLSQK